jgi:twitching motility protein PilT
MVTMEQDLHNLYTKKIISRETALDFSNNRKRIEQLLSFREICV